MSKIDPTELNNGLAIAEWYKSLKDTSNLNFLPLFFNEDRYLVLKGGGGSGKSIFAGRKILERCVSEKHHRFLVCRKVGKTIRDSCWTQLRQQISEHYAGVRADINKSDMRITFPATDSEIIFSGLDDVEKLKSIYNITGIWIEEASELLESDFNQLDIRLRGETKYYKQIILSFNPISVLHWLKTRFFDNPPDNATVNESTYKDNRFLDDAAKKVLEDFKLTDEYYYDVYCLGNWGVTGKTVFDGRAVARRLREIQPPKKTGRMVYEYDGLTISDYSFVDDPQGIIKIYDEPREGHTYIIGGDTAGDGSNSSILQVIDGYDGCQVATLKAQEIDEDLYAYQAYCIGMWYNKALIAVESNLSTAPIRTLERLRYPKQYVRETFDDATHKVKLSYGFRTDVKTRPVIISGLVTLVRDDVGMINDKDTLNEMLTFIRNPDTYKPEAEEGAHDDCVMALAIAHFARQSGQIKLVQTQEERKTVQWTKDMYQDYKAASKADKEILIEKWGKPDKWL